jgi:site-specific DNA-methyltransferase (adenine-specific)
MSKKVQKSNVPTSTVGRSKAITLESEPLSNVWNGNGAQLHYGDTLDVYKEWPKPTVIVSDGGYGVLGFEGDTSDHLELPKWYEPHIEAWSKYAIPETTLWFWNSEIGWAAVHPVLEKYGWRYQNANVWNKGKAHIAGNVNTSKIRRFPVVSEVCVQYVFEAKIDGMVLKKWLKTEWKRTGLVQRKANEACGVKDAATRKYLDQGHLWYFPPPEMFEKIQEYANEHGKPEGRPYFSINGINPGTKVEWKAMRSKFNCPHGFTNVWDRLPVSGKERLRTNKGKAIHLNQKPLDLMRMIVNASSDEGDVVWEPFGGLFSASYAACELHRNAYASEIDSTYYQYGIKRFIEGYPGTTGPLFQNDL